MATLMTHDTWANLPAVTLPLPAISEITGAWRAGLTVTGEWRAHGRSLKARDEARWARWGAARDGAKQTVSPRQIITSVLLGGGLAALLALNWHLTLVLLVGLLIWTYIIAGAYKCWLMARGEQALHANDIANDRTQASATTLADGDLPVYTVLVPLFHEGRILPSLVQRLAALDYPHDRLEVRLLIESDDDETRAALEYLDLPSFIQPLNVPAGAPRTKPRALNVGLAQARGEYIVVYDAEDRPEPDQLRKAVEQFRQESRKVVCLQARLNFYNADRSALARLFAIDYTLWYNLLLPGLTHLPGFVPLGGTSNHFRVTVLRRLGGWDPYNVTEDCDLGARIARARLQVGMLDSLTWEEAVTKVRPWVRQRSRWVKGYLQTYLVHMRHPLTLWRELGPLGFLDFQLLVGGASFAMLANPLMWGLTVTYAVSHGTPVAGFVEALFPPAIYYPSLLCLVVGNFIFFYSNLYACVRSGYLSLTRYALLGPIYWVLMSVGAWAGLISLIRDPHYWAKTEHGMSLAPDELAPQTALTPTPIATSQSATQASAVVTHRGVSVVLPAYNEEAIIGDTIQRCIDALSASAPNFEIIVVDDGSRDQTGAIVDAFAADNRRVRAIHNRPNRGYGGALLAGFATARKELTFFMDSDGQFDIDELATLLAYREQGYRVVLGYREHRSDPPLRLVNAWGWKMLNRLLFGLRVHDIDCAFKLFDTNLIQACDIWAEGAMINAEMLVKLRKLNVAFMEVPVRHYARTAGKATGSNLRVITRAFRELLRLQRNLRRWSAPLPVEVPAPTMKRAVANSAQPQTSCSGTPRFTTPRFARLSGAPTRSLFSYSASHDALYSALDTVELAIATRPLPPLAERQLRED